MSYVFFQLWQLYFSGFYLTVVPIIDIENIHKRNNIKLKSQLFLWFWQNEMHNFLRIKFIQIQKLKMGEMVFGKQELSFPITLQKHRV